MVKCRNAKDARHAKIIGFRKLIASERGILAALERISSGAVDIFSGTHWITAAPGVAKQRAPVMGL